MRMPKPMPATILPRLALLAVLSLASPALLASGYDQVDPFIGTGGEGHTFPGAVAPFGMVQLSLTGPHRVVRAIC